MESSSPSKTEDADLREALRTLCGASDMIALKRRWPEVYVKVTRYSFLVGFLPSSVATEAELAECASLKIELEALGFYPGWD